MSRDAEDGLVRVDVSDHGPGIPHDQQGLIFEKFGRVAGPGAAKPGTGLGLFIARSIAEAHGGSLEVESAPNAGAIFTLDAAGRLARLARARRRSTPSSFASCFARAAMRARTSAGSSTTASPR